MAEHSLPILVVEDDPSLREAIGDTLELAGRPYVAVDGGAAALKVLGEQAFSIVVSDVRMMPMDGIALLKEIRLRLPHLPVVLMTAYAEVDKAVDAMRSGACDFLLKPFEPQALLAHINKYELPETGESAGVVAIDPVSRELFAIAQRVAQTDATVLLTGESGVGKEVVARFIHRNSARKDGPFVAINCAAIPDSLLEATLFGYEKGAFTGAQQAQAGKFEQAQDGTLLLDEVTEMPMSLQAKLLRVLQEREVERVGGKKPVPLNIRIIATSNREMAEAVAKGVFREDLYYRLNVFPVAIPGLRQRRGDIVAIARHFVVEHGGRFGRSGVSLSPAAELALTAHDWPGNVRELENVIQRALILSTGPTIGTEHLNLVAKTSPGAAMIQVPLGDVGSAAGLTEVEKRADNMKDLERDHILRTLTEVGGSRKMAIERLGISERTLRYKLQQYRDEGFFKD
ncbi:sigma-54-dependent transcriptional regulator [Dechloromonas denitrificans]|uniref:sigma-54-dependent transcriptional regulator n=1 Tax=Dechloromonas denitrificans TaxID=281362 RepID=UPI001CF92D17|nr:sigma-54 dependent transcriptional regulator [Dechloromonas denitrificans]UCV04563.1 sigma-54-dependent Fis family transcriptional regulator [Dechloromonas denitrificans]UCV08892.1 sigma-54-dependent Fis family transcriptional regulator [Dechloromonas denitrificans]